jgi:undecaprenyl-diphosphatase
MARGLRFDRPSAARLSFLMSVPITIGAIVFKLGKLFVLGNGIPSGFGGAFAVGIIASAISGFIAVAGLLKLIRTQTFLPFVAYRVVAGVGVIALAASSFR